MKLTGPNLVEVRESLAKTLEACRVLVAEERLAEAHNRMYDAEKVAWDADLYEEAADFRKAQMALREGRVPPLLP